MGLRTMNDANVIINNLKNKNKKLIKALNNLVNLKIHKETFGKTEYYEKNKELAWDEAKELVGFMNNKEK